MRNSDQIVVVLGASPKSERYSNRAIQMLQHAGYPIIPIHPKFSEIEGLPVTKSLQDVDVPVHTLTLYVSPARLELIADQVVALKPGRVIFNPGSESPRVQKKLDEAGILWLQACTLVMLQTKQF